jgi:signal transduction histidine kinase
VGSQQTQPPRVPDGRSPLWRAHNVFRVLTLLWAVFWFGVQMHDYARPELASVVIAIMVVWTVFTIWRYRTRSGRTKRLVLIDQVVVTILFLSSEFILTEDQMTLDSPSVVSLWQPTMVTAAATQWGMLGGGISGVVAAACNFLIRNHYTPPMWTDTVLLLGTGLLVGLASDTARKSTERLSRALRAEAATAERERLARSIHDSVLQVLARVRRRGNELGGEAAELAHLAGEQEVALRALVAAAPPESNENGETDLAARLHTLRAAKTEVSVPATQVPLPESVVSDLFAVAREALENVERHAGSTAKAWVLLEDLGDEVVISIRDNGPGIPDGRLDEAAEEGRIGVAQSIRGRVAGLDGTISLDTAPGEGTEWEIRVPRAADTGQDERRKGVTR